jgi:hypothetical protein
LRESGAGLEGRAEDVLAPGRYVEGRWLSDEQRRRQAVIERMFAREGGQGPELSRPLLLGWSDPVDLGFQFPPHQQQVGTALWLLPLEIEKPPAGTKVVIPSPFVVFRAVNRVTSENASPLYNYRTGHWVQSQKPTETWLSFQVPEGALPLQLERARLTVQITAPSRSVKIVQLAGDDTAVLRTVNNPIGRIELTLEGPTLPVLDSAGRLQLGLIVSEAADGARSPMQASAWKIDTVQMEVAGTVSAEKPP